MKKLLALFIGLILTTPLFANTISLPSYISGNDVTIANLNSTNTTVQNWANGNVEGGGINIKAGSLTSQDFAQSVSIVTFRDEAFNDWTYSGMLPVTSVSLTTTTSAGISYVNGIRIQTASTSHGYTASKDTYLYINQGGYFDYVEVANGGAAPSTPANDLLLAKVVSSGIAITSVQDLRTTSIQITVNGSNFPADYRNQVQVIRDSSSAMHVEPGQLAIGSTLYSNLADTSSKATSTSSNWVEGTPPNLNGLHFYIYGFNNSGTAYDFKFASADPTYSDTSSNNGGTLQYYINGGTTYRALGWVSADSSGNIQTYNFSQFPSASTVNKVEYITGAVATGTTVIPYDDTIPQISEGDEYMALTFKPVNANDTLIITVTFVGAISTNDIMTVALFQDSTANAIAAVYDQHSTSSYPHTTTFSYKMVAGSTSYTVFHVRAGDSAAGTTTFNGAGGARKMGGVSASSIRIEEVAS